MLSSAFFRVTLASALVTLAAQPCFTQDTVPAPATGEERDDVVVTASRHDKAALDLPFAVSTLNGETARHGPDGRSLPNALSREPSVMVQKTGPGQSSPYIRGFSGYRTLFLIDGVRLNNSIWRDGPNQYSGTVDLWGIDELELVRGPASVLWGSDAVGGTVNARTTRAVADGTWGGSFSTRWSSAERSLINRLAFEGGAKNGVAIKGGITDKNFGTLHAGRGSGDLRGTSYDELDVDVRVDVPTGLDQSLTFVAQRVRQYDVPRTHKTVDSVPFHSTTVGTELSRDIDQARDLIYGRYRFAGDADSLYDEATVTVSWQRQQQDQLRMRTGGRLDARGLDVATTGVSAEFVGEAAGALWTWGTDFYHDDVSSYRRDVTLGVPGPPNVQGPVGDDASYDLLGLFAQGEFINGDTETTAGVRFSQAHAQAHQVDNPNVPGSSPFTPGNVIRVDERWHDLTASLRVAHHISDNTMVYAGVSQGFRAPNLSDLTSDLEDSGVESPTPDLDPEKFLSVELGAKTQHDGWNGEIAAHYTFIDDMIVRSPTGALLGGLPVFRKDNVGDGQVFGIELRGERDLGNRWTAFASASWIDGEIDQFNGAGTKVEKPLSRLMPLTVVGGATYESEDGSWWVQGDTVLADAADKLSLRDESDTSRIPPGGTPGYGILGVRGAVQLNTASTLFLGVENLLNKDYRIHGSGQNEPGRSLVAQYSRRF
ncbi:MAG: hemoglobin/transferrin/lactoferrin receptor protein [Pseudohongiellaceae bacterium]|jgi:hemoglobin/transferrin/lactoferrin receptor protein